MTSRLLGLKVIWLALAGVFAAVACVLAVLEIGIRILHPEATRPYLVARLEREKATWARPDSVFHHVGDGIYHLAFPVSTDTSKPRIMLIGDSFTMGHVVGETKRFGTLLQGSLGTRATVNVLATSGYSPVIYRNVVRRALSLAHYDVVAVFVDQSDPPDELIYKEDLLENGASGKFNLPRMLHRAQVVQDAYAGLLRSVARWNSPRRFALLNYFKPLRLLDALRPDDEFYHDVRRITMASPELIYQFTLLPDAVESRVMQSLLVAHLDEIEEMCRAAHVALVLTANPWEVQSARDPRVRRRFVGPFPAKNRLETLLVERYGKLPGIFVMRMTEAFRAHEDPSSLFLSRPANEIHWSERGNAFVEGLLRDFLRNEVHFPAN